MHQTERERERERERVEGGVGVATDSSSLAYSLKTLPAKSTAPLVSLSVSFSFSPSTRFRIILYIARELWLYAASYFYLFLCPTYILGYCFLDTLGTRTYVYRRRRRSACLTGYEEREREREKERWRVTSNFRVCFERSWLLDVLIRNSGGREKRLALVVVKRTDRERERERDRKRGFCKSRESSLWKKGGKRSW